MVRSWMVATSAFVLFQRIDPQVAAPGIVRVGPAGSVAADMEEEVLAGHRQTHRIEPPMSATFRTMQANMMFVTCSIKSVRPRRRAFIF